MTRIGEKLAGGILARENGATIAYRRTAGKNPGVVFIHGLRSDMNGTKALALEAHCQETGRAFLCFDLTGHGAEAHRFEEGTIGAWAADVVAMLDELTEGPQILVGSSLGGWLMLLAALARPDRVAGLMGLAAAPDFTERLIYAAFDEKQRRDLIEEGRVLIDDCYGQEPYAITRALIEEGRNHLLLDGPIAISRPTLLIQGQQDEDVPWQTALTLAEKLSSPQVRVVLLKSGNHRLSEPEDLRLILTNLDYLIYILSLD
jgi:pimeloyl-ACP methyl ester carboxylesterase